METTIIRIGNSDGLRLSSKLLKSCSLKRGDKVNIHVVDKKLVIGASNPFAELDALGMSKADPRDALEIAGELRASRADIRSLPDGWPA